VQQVHKDLKDRKVLQVPKVPLQLLLDQLDHKVQRELKVQLALRGQEV